MRLPTIGSDSIMIACLLVVGAFALITGHKTGLSISKSLLMQQAHNDAGIWYRHLGSMPQVVRGLIKGQGESEQLRTATTTLKHFTHIVRYEIFSARGRFVYSSGKIKDKSVPPLTAAFMIKDFRPELIAQQSKIQLFSSEDRSMPANYAAVLSPLIYDGERVGSVLIYIDQSRAYASLESAFNTIAAITLLLLLASLLVPLVFIGFKIIERWKAEKRIRFLAHYDPLTSLANRVTFHDKLKETLERRNRTNTKMAVMFLDMDRFKEINDTLGHAMGDLLLKQFAERLRSSVRDVDVTARLSGDEFAVLLTDLPTVDYIHKPVNRLLDKMAEPFQLGDKSCRCTVSIGIAVSPDHGDDQETLMRHADTALYQAKGNGRNTWAMFDPEMDRDLHRRVTLEAELQRATHSRGFELYFQPQFDLASGTMTGNEALLRWNSPSLGVVTPAEFIPIAEDSGLIVPISAWVIETACKTASSWSRPLRVAVNISPVLFKRGKVSELVRQALDKTGLPADRLEVEITETVLLSNSDAVMEELKALRALGVSIALDDFGTGYSSLSYLSHFRFDKIKIDRSFVKDVVEDHTVRAITRSIVELGKSLEIAILAEGIETDSQADLMRNLGCEQVQGFLFGPPLPRSSFKELVERTHVKDKKDGEAGPERRAVS